MKILSDALVISINDFGVYLAMVLTIIYVYAVLAMNLYGG